MVSPCVGSADNRDSLPEPAASVGPSDGVPGASERLRRRRMPVDGFVVVDKPGGLTSHDVVARMRRLARTRRVGHAGTLDPMATGVLIIGIGRATRLLSYAAGHHKAYQGTVRLGQTTVTDDA